MLYSLLTLFEAFACSVVCRLRILGPLLSAFRAQAGELQVITKDLVVVVRCDTATHRLYGQVVDVSHSPALNASHVVVLADVSIEPGLTAGNLELENLTSLDKLIEIAVHRSKADLR